MHEISYLSITIRDALAIIKYMQYTALTEKCFSHSQKLS